VMYSISADPNVGDRIAEPHLESGQVSESLLKIEVELLLAVVVDAFGESSALIGGSECVRDGLHSHARLTYAGGSTTVSQPPAPTIGLCWRYVLT
jgi:hypothetical protein